MPIHAWKEDLRSVRTEKALDGAMLSLLETRNFRKITVIDICTAALISRPTFYAHFTDKYDLLRGWLARVSLKYLHKGDPYNQVEKRVNQLIYDHKTVVYNIVDDADEATIEILFDTMLSTLNCIDWHNNREGARPKQVVFSNFCAGGMVFYLFWQAKNKFPPHVPPLNAHLHEIIERLRQWELDLSQEN